MQKKEGYNRTSLSVNHVSHQYETRVLQTHVRCSRLRRHALERQSNVDGRSRTQADGRLGRDVLFTDLVAVQPQRLQSGEVGHVGEGAEASQSEFWGGRRTLAYNLTIRTSQRRPEHRGVGTC